LLLVDSLTRMARAIRDVSLASGETPIRQGFTPSVFSELPKLIERAGNDANGSITAIYTLLDTSEHELDPLAEEAKSLLDGHISLDSTVALSGVRPAIDFTRSISRLNNLLHKKDYLKNQSYIIRMISRLKRDKDLVLLGGTADTELERFIKYEPELINFLNQHEEEKIDLMQSLSDFTMLHTGVYT
jgi:flagellar biosynthesis/type III secretory pathway ATPase